MRVPAARLQPDGIRAASFAASVKHQYAGDREGKCMKANTYANLR
ncbi:MAG: hypothetical protein AVDCRST_MAG93-7359 [uncultured Chloroflexia bacterium]|uniref:Uncharacterized protein n=1 Tax=uncultured Chloroflexia bacterium TaxID=1672391 RepID=A0A6J4MCH5_9CHLR|nr:MAG: hypothetical protein AVDCRST_MAG93-7359 [uncultured Chloroflexia bacterium]